MPEAPGDRASPSPLAVVSAGGVGVGGDATSSRSVTVVGRLGRRCGGLWALVDTDCDVVAAVTRVARTGGEEDREHGEGGEQLRWTGSGWVGSMEHDVGFSASWCVPLRRNPTTLQFPYSTGSRAPWHGTRRRPEQRDQMTKGDPRGIPLVSVELSPNRARTAPPTRRGPWEALRSEVGSLHTRSSRVPVPRPPPQHMVTRPYLPSMRLSS